MHVTPRVFRDRMVENLHQNFLASAAEMKGEGGGDMKALTKRGRHAPQNGPSGPPVMMTARTVSRLSRCARTATSSPMVLWAKAFRFAGRLNWIKAVPLSSSTESLISRKLSILGDEENAATGRRDKVWCWVTSNILAALETRDLAW